MIRFFLPLMGTLSLVMLFGLAALPMGQGMAFDTAVACAAGILVLALVPGRTARLFFLTLCAWVVVRYISWRFYSFPSDNGLPSVIAAAGLLLAELYGVAMLLTGIFVNAFPLERKPVALPKDQSKWPTVDIYIPTYSEPISVVAPTLLAATEIDYPKDKFRVWILDDGHPRSLNPKTDPTTAMELAERSEELKQLCERHGAGWLTRPKNEHAKSGNMNSAMAQTDGQLLLILDADHVPTRDILRNTVGFFKDERIAFVQTPHFFVNPDPVERNLGLHNRMPAENDMFYRVVQKGLDLWNTSFFCGSAAVLRRTAVEDIGGFSTESITEDASTSVKMHQRGWKSAYLDIPMVAGLQPETFASFTVQRLRWAMGMVQILLKQNPLFVRGLGIGQRVSYLSVMLFWFFPFARVMFFIAPLLSLFLGLSLYPTGLENFAAYTLPYLLAVVMSFEKTFGKVRRIIISEVYECLQAFYALPAIIGTLMRPSAPTFKVTPKGERLDKEFISELNKPFYVFYALTAVGLIWAATLLVLEPHMRQTLSLSIVWLGFNFVLLSAALGVLVEKPVLTARPIIDLNERVDLLTQEGMRPAVLLRASELEGVLKVGKDSQDGEVVLYRDGRAVDIAFTPPPEGDSNLEERHFTYMPGSAQQERDAVMLAYAESSRWQKVWQQRECRAHFTVSALAVVLLSLRHGFSHLRRLVERVDA